MGKRMLSRKQETFLCNDCGKVMKMRIREEVIDRDEDGREIIEQYMQCGNCKRRYTIIILDEYMRTKIAEKKTTDAINRKIVIMRETKEHLQELKRKYGRN